MVAACMHASTYIQLYVYVYRHICIKYTYICKHRARERERETLRDSWPAGNRRTKAQLPYELQLPEPRFRSAAVPPVVLYTIY